MSGGILLIHHYYNKSSNMYGKCRTCTIPDVKKPLRVYKKSLLCATEERQRLIVCREGGRCGESAQQQTLHGSDCHLPSVELSFDSGTHEHQCCGVGADLRWTLTSFCLLLGVSCRTGHGRDRIRPCHLLRTDYKRVGGPWKLASRSAG